MARATAKRVFAFDLGEVTGAIGDSITVLPLVVALGVLTPASLVHLLAGFGVFQVVWGVHYGVPLSVEPMKALASLAIAGAIGYGDLLTAGLLAGCLLLISGRLGAVSRLTDFIGEPVVRGVQFAVACLLVLTAADLVAAAPAVAAVGVAVAAVVAFLSPRAVALAVLAVGLGWAVTTNGVPMPTAPSLTVFPNGFPTLSLDAIEGLIAQLAMTVGNAAVATSLLLSDYYDADISPDRLAESMGSMNLLVIPFGGLPMCHGSGGLAGKHAFGARTATANLIAGCLYLALAAVAGLLVAFPMALLGVLLVIVAGSLARRAFTESDRWLFVASVGGLAVLTNVGLAFVAGAVWWQSSERASRFCPPSEEA